jgi:hypothetical protein
LISRALQSLRRFSKELNKPRARWTEEGITGKIQKWLSGQFLSEVIRYQLESRDGQWRLQFDLDQAAYVHRQAKAAWSDLPMEQLIKELQQIQQFILPYPRQGEKGPDRAAYVLSKQTLAQQALAKARRVR